MKFPSGCSVALLRPDAVSKAFLGTLFDVFADSWAPFWTSWGSLRTLVEPLWAILGGLGANLGWFGATFVRFERLVIFGLDFGSKKGGQRGAFWEANRSKHRSKIAV